MLQTQWSQSVNRRSAIGVYDSGMGGLSVLAELKKKLPHEHFIYFADTKHLPYGDKSKEQIITYSQDIIDWLQHTMKVKMVVVACNTSSTLALKELSNHFLVPVVGTIEPLIKGVLARSDINKLGVIATEASINSGVHKQRLLESGFAGQIMPIACPNLVPCIETYPIDWHELTQWVDQYLAPVKATLDSLVYGCTHYPFMHHIIEQILPQHVRYFDPAHYIAMEVDTLLMLNGWANDSLDIGSSRFYCSEDPEGFGKKLQALMGLSNISVQLTTF